MGFGVSVLGRGGGGGGEDQGSYVRLTYIRKLTVYYSAFLRTFKNALHWNEKKIYFILLGNRAPSDRIRVEVRLLHISEVLVTVMCSLAAAGILVASGFLYFNITNRKLRYAIKGKITYDRKCEKSSQNCKKQEFQNARFVILFFSTASSVAQLTHFMLLL